MSGTKSDSAVTNSRLAVRSRVLVVSPLLALSLAMAGAARGPNRLAPDDEQRASALEERGIASDLKWQQLPDLGPTSMVVFAQWPPAVATGVVAANDFPCTVTGPITEIHVWGGWYQDYVPADLTFVLSIHDNVPVARGGGGGPGDLLWMREFSQVEFTAQPYANVLEGFYDPSGDYYEPGTDTICWEYIFYVPAGEQFTQLGTVGSPITYWLDVQALPAEEAYFGWKTTTLADQWSSMSFWTEGSEPAAGPWAPLFYPGGHELTGAPLDLAFAIYGLEDVCEPDAAGTACKRAGCPNAGEDCAAKCMNYDPVTGVSTVIACECDASTDCHAESAPVPANRCVQPDNGTGTVTLPPQGCEYLSPDEVHLIIDGLPPGTTIELDAIHMDFVCGQPSPMCSMLLAPGECEAPGGSLGGNGDCFESVLDLTVSGTGMLAGFNRHLAVPVFTEVHTGPRNPGDPVQTFPNDMYRLMGELFGDPDFCTFRVTGGTDFGLPGPGQTTLTDIGGGLYEIDSFFDVAYVIEFEGCPGSILEGFAGATMAVIRMQTGGAATPPTCVGDCPVGTVCEETVTPQADGTQDVCCNCVSTVCEPTADGSGCTTGTCTEPGEECQASCMNFDPASGTTTVIACECDAATDCHAEPGPPATNSCVQPDNGTRTVTLPPIGCDYIGPYEVHEIIDGLPPGTTIELDPIHMDFICTGTSSGVCSLALAPGTCEIVGGSLGGHGDCFESTLDLTVSGTGSLAGFNRHLAVPMGCEVHTGPRNPGDPVQSFATDMYRLQGELFGDPDFCTFRVTGGTDFGLPSPGQTTLTDIGGGVYNIDSFFDVMYQIEFEGCPGSQLDSYSGITTATIRMAAGGMPAPPTCVGNCPLGTICEQTVTPQPDGTNDVCCNCVPAPCEPTADGSQCQPAQECADLGQVCEARCANVDLTTGEGTFTDCDCSDVGDCHVDIPPPPANPNPCVVNDNGTGTVTLPPDGCDYIGPDEVHEIINGLPPNTTIELDPIHTNFMNVSTTPGGSLGGEIETFDSALYLTVRGTGSLAGFNRSLAVPVSSEVHTGPRTPGDPVQSFANDMFRLQGELFGDPDFCTFRVIGGTDFGLPSPGQTTLTSLGDGRYHIDSFFDVTYQIDFEGCPGSQLDGYMGLTTATIRMRTGTDLPTCSGDCPVGFVCKQTVSADAAGNIDVCCDCVPDVCAPNADGSACERLGCHDAGEQCDTKCLRFDPGTGQSTVVACDCRDPAGCHVEDAPGQPYPCVVPDNGTGTATLPPIGCEYIGPDEVHEIINGLPPGTTIELDPIHMDFICPEMSTFCTIPLPFGLCEIDGGSLGGDRDCFESTLDLKVRGTGGLAGFNRHLAVPVSAEVHTGPRNPGDPVQSFATDMYRLQGELFGDPDFCTFRVTGGTDFGLPGPGHTTLTELSSGDFAVDSFFDVSYQIDFEGCPGSQLDGYAGITTATIRMRTGATPPVCVSDCPLGTICEQSRTTNADGTIDVCCDCVPAPTGACCYYDGINRLCTVTSADICSANYQGEYQGDDTVCGETGSCCFDADGNGFPEVCQEMAETCCDTLGGTFTVGDDCSNTGACCYGGDFASTLDACEATSQACCDSMLNSTFHPSLVCSPAGACCYDADFDGTAETCIEISEICCEDMLGVFEGEGSACIPDPCETCLPSSPAEYSEIFDWSAPGFPKELTTNRFLVFTAGDVDQNQAIRVTFVNLPPPFDLWNGAQLWVGPTSQVTEAAANVSPTEGYPNFTAARLRCATFYTDWSSHGTLHVFHEGIVPGGDYRVEVIDETCDVGDKSDFSVSLDMTTAIWGDTVRDLAQTPPLPPNGPPVGIDDALGILGRFSNVPGAIIKARADLEPACLDLKINVTDVLSSLAGFAGLSYPFTMTAADPCDSTCPNVLP